MMIEKRELEDIRRHNKLRHMNKNKKGNHINRRQYNQLINRMKRNERKHMREKHPYREITHPVHHSMFNGANMFIQLRQSVQKRVKSSKKINQAKINKAKYSLKNASKMSIKKHNMRKLNNKKLRNKRMQLKNKKSISRKPHVLNHSESVKRGVAKIFKGFKIGKRRSAA